MQADVQVDVLLSVQRNSRGKVLAVSGTHGLSDKSPLAIYLAACGIFLASILAGYLTVNVASLEANRFAIKTEHRLVESELANLVERSIREQAEISYWDDAMQELVLSSRPSKVFARELIAEWLVPDMGFSDFALIGEDGSVLMSATGESVETALPETGLSIMAKDIVQKARDIFRDKRIQVGSKYMVVPEHGRVVPNIQAYAHRMWKGVPTLIVAQVMIAEERSYAAGDGQETVLLSAKPITDQIVAASQRRLGLENVAIGIAGADAISDLDAIVAMPDLAAAPTLRFAWQPKAPRALILKESLPIGAAMAIALFSIMTFIIRRHAMTLRQLANSEATNRFLATHDPLTGIANRKQFDNRLDETFNVSRSSCFSVICIDLDRFKQVNDKYGHPAGDAVLREVASRFAALIDGKGTVARIGGDEFVALVTDFMSEDELLWLADTMIEQASAPIFFEGSELKVGASIGIAIAPRDGVDPRSILRSADMALYQSKNAGRGCASVWKKAA